MSGKILQLNFKFSVSRAELEQAVSPVVSQFAVVASLLWKIWMISEEEQEVGRIYLFDDEASVKEFLAGPLAAGLTGQPAFSHISVKQFDVIEDPTAITRGPVREGCPGLGYNRPAGGQTVKIIK